MSDEADRIRSDLDARLRPAELDIARHGERLNAHDRDIASRVHASEFLPVKLVLYGLVGIVLSACIGAVVRMIGLRP